MHIQQPVISRKACCPAKPWWINQRSVIKNAVGLWLGSHLPIWLGWQGYFAMNGAPGTFRKQIVSFESTRRLNKRKKVRDLIWTFQFSQRNQVKEALDISYAGIWASCTNHMCSARMRIPCRVAVEAASALARLGTCKVNLTFSK